VLSTHPQPASYNTSQTPSLHHLIVDPHSTGHVQPSAQQQQTQQQHSNTIANMALTAEREAYLRLAAHSMERSEHIAPHFNIRSPKAYGGYIPPLSQPGAYDQPRSPFMNGQHSLGSNGLSPSSSSYPSQQHLSDTNLYIKNLPPEYSDQDLAKLVEGCGKVKSMKAIIDKQTNKCKGFGFIDFETNEDAQLAINQLQKKGFTAQLAKSSQQQEQDTTNLYFANLDPRMTEQDLREALSQYGLVVSVRILRDQQKQSRGVGFARMNDREQCQAIINQFHNQSFPDFSDKHVHVKFADASNKNKKLYKGGLDDMKSGHPLYPMDQTVSYPSPAVVFPPWASMSPAQLLPQQTSNHQQQQAPQPTIVSGPPHHHNHHPMYAQAPQLRQQLGVYNPTIPSYMQLSHGPGHETAFVLPMQQLQQLQIANGHPGAFCLVNSPHPHAHPHPALFMQAPQQNVAAQPHPQQQSVPPPPQQNDSPLVTSQDLS